MEGFNRFNCQSALTKQKYISNQILQKNGVNSLFSNSLVTWYTASQHETNKYFPKLRQEAKPGKIVFGSIPLLFQVILCLKINSFLDHTYFTKTFPEPLTYQHVSYLRTTANHLCSRHRVTLSPHPSSRINLKKPTKHTLHLVRRVAIQYVSQF